MDKLDQYREIILRVINEYASFKPSYGEVNAEVVVDRDRNHFELLHMGWDRESRVHGTVLHVDIQGDKIWIQYDGTDHPIAEELVAAGIPQKDIVLAFHPARLRPLTGYGVE
jgi:hypothetical protein